LLSRAGAFTRKERLKTLELMSIRQSVDNLMTFPFVAEAIERGKMVLLVDDQVIRGAGP
jgi:carbonic anhydrase